MIDLTAIDERARVRHGIATFSDLDELGCTPTDVLRLRKRGHLVDVHRGVYRMAGSPTTWRQQVMAAVAGSNGRAFASHRTGVALHPLYRVRGGIIEITSSEVRPARRSHITTHRTLHLPIVDRWFIDSIPVTALDRTLIDAGRYLDAHRIGMLVDHAVRDGLTTYESFEARVQSLGRQGRNGIGVAREVLAARGLDGTWAFEKAMRRAIHEGGLPAPVREFRIDVGRERYYVDFAYPEAGFGIECDSREWQTLPYQVDADLTRQNDIVGSGFPLLRYTPTMLRNDPERVVREIGAQLRLRTPS
ncbi:MAG: type IV toxin-antitoxin system AbiEi family antitoxin domain-containing protein [Acidimicrobiales bacterium]